MEGDYPGHEHQEERTTVSHFRDAGFVCALARYGVVSICLLHQDPSVALSDVYVL